MVRSSALQSNSTHNSVGTSAASQREDRGQNRNATSLVRLHPYDDSWFISHGRTVMRTARHGFIPPESEYGLFCYETRVLSRYEWRINEQALISVALSNVRQSSWMGYYVMLPPGADAGPQDKGSGDVQAYSEKTLEMRISRFAAGGIHEDIDLENYSLDETSFELELLVDADFAAVTEAESQRRSMHRKKTVEWIEAPARPPELMIRHAEKHRYSHQGDKGVSEIDRRVRIRIRASDTVPSYCKADASVPTTALVISNC